MFIFIIFFFFSHPTSTIPSLEFEVRVVFITFQKPHKQYFTISAWTFCWFLLMNFRLFFFFFFFACCCKAATIAYLWCSSLNCPQRKRYKARKVKETSSFDDCDADDDAPVLLRIFHHCLPIKTNHFSLSSYPFNTISLSVTLFVVYYLHKFCLFFGDAVEDGDDEEWWWMNRWIESQTTYLMCF